MFAKYVAQTKSLQEKDAPGNFLCWLFSRSPVWVYQISGRFDIGGLDTYIKCNETFVPRKSRKNQDDRKERRQSLVYEYFV